MIHYIKNRIRVEEKENFLEKILLRPLETDEELKQREQRERRFAKQNHAYGVEERKDRRERELKEVFRRQEKDFKQLFK